MVIGLDLDLDHDCYLDLDLDHRHRAENDMSHHDYNVHVNNPCKLQMRLGLYEKNFDSRCPYCFGMRTMMMMLNQVKGRVAWLCSHELCAHQIHDHPYHLQHLRRLLDLQTLRIQNHDLNSLNHVPMEYRHQQFFQNVKIRLQDLALLSESSNFQYKVYKVRHHELDEIANEIWSEDDGNGIENGIGEEYAFLI